MEELTKKETTIAICIILAITLFILGQWIGRISADKIDCKLEVVQLADYIEIQLNDTESMMNTIPYFKLIEREVDTIQRFYFDYKMVSRQALENHLEVGLWNITEGLI